MVSSEPVVNLLCQSRSRAVGRSSPDPRGRVRQSLTPSPPAAILRGWPGGCPARRGILPADRRAQQPRSPTVLAVAGSRRTDAAGVVWCVFAELFGHYPGSLRAVAEALRAGYPQGGRQLEPHRATAGAVAQSPRL